MLDYNSLRPVVPLVIVNISSAVNIVTYKGLHLGNLTVTCMQPILSEKPCVHVGDFSIPKA